MQKSSLIYIYGNHSVREEILQNPKKISKLYLKHGFLAREDWEAMAKKLGIPIQLVDERTLDTLTDHGLHQGVVLEVHPPDFMNLKDWIVSVKDISRPMLVILDEIEDPHNVGAIVRSATAAGAHGILIGTHRQAAITGTVYKTSAGTLGKIPLIEVSNVNDAIVKLKDNRFWIIGLDMNASKTLWEEEFDAPIALVVGGEGTGMRRHTGELCDIMVKIPMENSVESLNASVSAALVLYEWKRKNVQ